MIEYPTSLLGTWPGRLRFAALLTALAADDRPEPESVRTAVLDGLGAATDEAGAFRQLVDLGEFRLADNALSKLTDLPDWEVQRLADELAVRRDDGQRDVTRRLEDLRRDADRADVAIMFDDDAWIARAQDNLAPVERALAELVDRVRSEVGARSAALRDRLESVALRAKPAWYDRCSELIEAGWLSIAERLIENGEVDGPSDGPLVVAPLPPWAWRHRADEEVLEWYLDPTEYRPREFLRLPHTADADVLEMLRAYRGLSAGGEQAAARFAAALMEFLGGPSDQRVARPVPGGHVVKLPDLAAREVDLVRFFGKGLRPALFVADPELSIPPPALADTHGRTIAVGPHLRKRSTERSSIAILTLRDLLRLATVGLRRTIAFARLMGRQWPLSALVDPVVQRLDDTIAIDTSGALNLLSWSLDLSGLGDAATAAAIQHESAFAGAVVAAFVGALDRHPEQDADSRIRMVHEWHCHQQLRIEIAKAVVQPLDAPAERAAFWSALSLARPGQAVAVSDVCAQAVQLAPPGGQVVIDHDAIVGGYRSLRYHPLVGTWTIETVALRPCGVLSRLAHSAEGELAYVMEQLVELEQFGRERLYASVEDHLLRGHRHSALWLERRVRALRLMPDVREDEIAAVERERDEAFKLALGEDHAVVTTFAVGQEIEDLCAKLRRARRSAEIVYEGGQGPMVTCIKAAFVMALAELINNAVEAMIRHGGATVYVDLKEGPGDRVFVEVTDEGAGINGIDEYRIFDPGTTTDRGGRRGYGLFIARQLMRDINGELELRRGKGSAFEPSGASFRLVLQVDGGALR